MRSDNVTKGSERAPNRSLFYALGYTPEELDRPLIGVVSAYSEIVPGHMNLDKVAEAVKAGVQMAGGTPILIPAIGVCDGIAMGHVGMKYSLASRELICDSVETMLMAHQLDGLVLVPNCDKIVPGMVMAAVRMDVPAVVCSGGPMLAGTYGGEEVSLSKMFEAVGAYKAGMISDEQLEDCTCNCCPSCGSCSGMYTANSMNCLCEAIGIALPGNGTIPAVYSKRLQLAKHAGMAIMEMVKKGITARQIINERSIRNALTCDMALGCSTNTVLHLLAIAYEAGVPIDLKLFNEISAKTPNLCHLAPAGPTHMPDLYAAGGIPAVQAELAKKGLLDLDVPTVTGKTLGENIKGAHILNDKAIRPIEDPYSPTGGLQILWGNIAPDGSVMVRDKELAKMNDEQLTIFRRRNIGFIFQNYNLVPILNVHENIVLPVELDGDTVDQKFMADVVSMLGLEDKLKNMPNNLSGGQQQRVAIARALVSKPAIVLADEPTGNLDSRTSADVLGLLQRTSREFNQTLVMITHNDAIAQLADRIVRIEDGKIVG